MVGLGSEAESIPAEKKRRRDVTKWRNRQSSTKAGGAHGQAKKTSLLTRKEGLVLATLESMPDGLPRRPVVAVRSRE